MENNDSKSATEIVETTIGDLVEAVTQIALEAGKTEQEGYILAAMTIERILSKNRHITDQTVLH